MTIARILCPVDFSDASQHAVEHALALARWVNASVAALHVCNPLLMPVPTLPPPIDRVPDAELQRVRQLTAERFKAAGGDDVDVLVDIGQPALCILERAAELPADLIVMGTHGASGFEHLVLGSVTEKVLRKANCPVLTVPPRARTTSSLPFRHLLCAIDFSDWSVAALELACSLARPSRSVLTLLHVIEWPWEEPPPPALEELPREQAAALAEYRRYLETSAKLRLDTLGGQVGAGVCPPRSRVAHGKAYVEILRTAASTGADLIVMGVRGRRATDVMLFGSTTNQVVRRASCPVLTLRK